MKSVIILQGIELRKTHDLEALYYLLAEEKLPIGLDEDEDSNITILGQSNKLQLRLRAFPEKPLTFFSPTNISIVTPRIFTYNDQKEYFFDD